MYISNTTFTNYPHTFSSLPWVHISDHLEYNWFSLSCPKFYLYNSTYSCTSWSSWISTSTHLKLQICILIYPHQCNSSTLQWSYFLETLIQPCFSICIQSCIMSCSFLGIYRWFLSKTFLWYPHTSYRLS